MSYLAMSEKIRCQSCAMPLGPGYFGTEQNGQEVLKYCIICYKDGDFVLPHQTMEDVIESSVKHMSESLGFTEAEARNISNQIIPTLERWK